MSDQIDAAAAAAAGAGGGAGNAGGDFKAADAVAFLTEHGADAKSLEGLAEPELKSRFESARTIAEKAAAKAAAASKAPEKYEPFKGADGKPADEKISAEVQALAKEFGLSQEKAQKLYDARTAAGQAHAKELGDRIAATHKEWQTQTRADKEFGGEKLNENLAIAKAAAEKFATPELSKLMDATGLGDHPEVIRVFYRIGKYFQNDKFVAGGARSDDKGPGIFSYDKSNHT